MKKCGQLVLLRREKVGLTVTADTQSECRAESGDSGLEGGEDLG